MRNRLVQSFLMLAIGTALSVTIAAQGPPPGAPPAGGQARPGGPGGGGRGRGFTLPPLLMETEAFPDGGIIPDKYTSAKGMSLLPGFKISNAPAATVGY